MSTLPTVPRSRLTGRLLFLVVVPLTYAGLLLFHPIPGPGPIYRGIGHDLSTWNAVHVAQLGFIGAMGGAVLWLVHGVASGAAGVARVAAVVFVLVYGAWETWTGIGTGTLAAAAQDLSPGQQTAAAQMIQAHWDSALLGNDSVGAVIGSAAWVVATAAAGLALHSRGVPTGAAVMLITAGLISAPTHVPPTGPLAMALFAVAVAWMELDHRPDVNPPQV